MLFQKLAVTDCPLYLRLLAGPDTNVLSFVLKENETGDVEVGLGPFAGVQTQPSWHSGWVQVGTTLPAPHMWGHMAAGKRLEKIELGKCWAWVLCLIQDCQHPGVASQGLCLARPVERDFMCFISENSEWRETKKRLGFSPGCFAPGRPEAQQAPSLGSTGHG